MFCPKCKSKYKAGYFICKDCKIPLVHELSPDPELEYVEYEEVLSTNNPGDVALLKSILDAEGITYYLQGEYVAPYVYHAIPIRLMVRKDQIEKAIEILKDLDLTFTFGSSKRSVDEEDKD